MALNLGHFLHSCNGRAGNNPGRMLRELPVCRQTVPACMAGTVAGKVVSECILSVEMNNAADTFALMHQIKGLVDLIQPHCVGDEIIQAEFSLQVTFDVIR